MKIAVKDFSNVKEDVEFLAKTIQVEVIAIKRLDDDLLLWKKLDGVYGYDREKYFLKQLKILLSKKGVTYEEL